MAVVGGLVDDPSMELHAESVEPRTKMVTGVVGLTCRLLGLVCAFVLTVAVSRVLLNAGISDPVGGWIGGEGSLSRLAVLVCLAVLVLSLLIIPLTVITRTWWRWLLCIAPVLVLQALYLYWIRGAGDGSAQGEVGGWFPLLFVVTPTLLLIGQITGGPTGQLLDERRRRRDAAVDAWVHSQLQRFRDQPCRGRPGLGQGGQDKFGDRAQAGSLGERRTAAIIDDWATGRSAVTVFHGLRFPGSATADVDHCIVVRQRVALLDSKNWQPGHYAFDRHGYVVRDDQPFSGGDVHMADAVRAYDRAWAEHGAKVTGWIVLTVAEGRTPPTVDNSLAPPELRLVTSTPDTGAALSWIDQWLHEDADDESEPGLAAYRSLCLLNAVDASRLDR